MGIGITPWRRLDGNWEYTLVEAARDEAEFELMETYIRKIHNVVAQYIETRSLLELCEVEERKQGERVGIRWWEQAVIDLLGVRETEVEADADKDGLE